MNDLTLQMQHETCQFATQLHTHTGRFLLFSIEKGRKGQGEEGTGCRYGATRGVDKCWQAKQSRKMWNEIIREM